MWVGGFSLNRSFDSETPSPSHQTTGRSSQPPTGEWTYYRHSVRSHRLCTSESRRYRRHRCIESNHRNNFWTLKLRPRSTSVYNGWSYDYCRFHGHHGVGRSFLVSKLGVATFGLSPGPYEGLGSPYLGTWRFREEVVLLLLVSEIGTRYEKFHENGVTSYNSMSCALFYLSLYSLYSSRTWSLVGNTGPKGGRVNRGLFRFTGTSPADPGWSLNLPLKSVDKFVQYRIPYRTRRFRRRVRILLLPCPLRLT